MNKVMNKVWYATVCCALVFGCSTAAAEGGDQPWEKGSLSIGGFITSSSTEIQVNSDTLGAGAVVDLENLLGVGSDKSTWRVDGFYRLGSSRRHQIDVHYYNSRRSGSRVLDQDIQVGDQIFPVNAVVDTRFDLTFVNADYSYAFLQDDRVRLAAAVGLHVTGVELKLQEVGGSAQVEEQSFTAPLPVVGLKADIALTQRWRLRGGIDVFYLSLSGYQGVLADSILAVEYLPFKHIGFGAGVNSLRINVKADGNSDTGLDLNGRLNFRFTGALLYVKAYY